MLGDLVVTLTLLVTLTVVTLAAAILLVIKFGHPDDKNQALWPKTVVILSLFLAAAAVFVFPLDVASTADPRLRWTMTVIWYAIFAGVAALLLLVVPISVSVYEDSDGLQSRSKLVSVMFGFFPLLLIGILAGCLYPFFSSYTLSAEDAEKVTGSFDEAAKSTVTFLLFAVAVLAMIGWAAFIVFVPIGLVVLPMDLINAFVTRPHPMSVADYSREKVQIGRKATHLLSVAKDEQQARESNASRRSKLSRSERKTQVALEIETYELRKRQAYLEEAYALRGGNPLWYFFQLILGIVFMIVTASWVVHITIFVLFGVSTGLNSVLSRLQSFPVGSIAYFALHALYLLAAAVKGAFRFSLGSKQLSIYPMEVGNTLMNAFLVNVWLILALVFPLIQFCAVSFKDYVSGTVIAGIVLRLNSLPLFKNFVFYQNIYLYIMGGLMFLTLLVTLACPKNTTRRLQNRLRNRVELMSEIELR